MNPTTRRSLIAKVSAGWRERGENDSDHAEVIYIKTGSALDTRPIEQEDTPESIVEWAAEVVGEFLKDVHGPQHFNLLVGKEKYGFYAYIEGEAIEPGGMAEAIVDQVLSHNAQLVELVVGATKSYKDVVEQLTAALKDKDATITGMIRANVDNAAAIGAIYDQKALRELEVQHLAASEHRKDLAADKVMGLLEQVTGMGGRLLVQKVEEKMGPHVLDQIASLLSEEEQKAFGDIIMRAQARAQERAAQAAQQAQAPSGANGATKGQ